MFVIRLSVIWRSVMILRACVWILYHIHKLWMKQTEFSSLVVHALIDKTDNKVLLLQEFNLSIIMTGLSDKLIVLQTVEDSLVTDQYKSIVMKSGMFKIFLFRKAQLHRSTNMVASLMFPMKTN